jgi:8-oxo-dGTP pyrophosphatase MutT (NUDIX family)
MADIYKSGGILLRDRKLLVSRSKGKDVFVAPGGKVMNGETAKQALIRELTEEFRIKTEENNLEYFGTFFAKAAGNEENQLKMDVYIVKSWKGEIVPDSEIEEIKWISFLQSKDMKIGSIFEHEVIPRLKDENLID